MDTICSQNTTAVSVLLSVSIIINVWNNLYMKVDFSTLVIFKQSKTKVDFAAFLQRFKHFYTTYTVHIISTLLLP